MDGRGANPGRELMSFAVADGWAQLFDRFFDDFPSMGKGGGFTPAIDVSENEKAITVVAELPGLKKEDIAISVDHGVLNIGGERSLEREEKGKQYHRIERRYGTFCRSLTLPGGVDGTKISARYKDGILSIEIPKSEEGKPRAIKIEAGE